MPIDALLKTRIEQSGIAPSTNKPLEELSPWLLNKWMPFCLNLMKEELLLPSFKRFLNDENKAEVSDVTFDTKTQFFSNLFIECSQEFDWFTLDERDLKLTETIWLHLEKNVKSQEEQDAFNQQFESSYQSAIHDWIIEKLDSASQDNQEKSACLENALDISYTHDPFLNRAYQIDITCKNIHGLVNPLSVIREAYRTFNIEHPLPYQIKMEQAHYRLHVDFSSHTFDCIDRMALLNKINVFFKLDMAIFTNTSYPSIAMMHAISSELVLLPIPKNRAQLLNITPEPNESREDYFKNKFSPLYKYLRSDLAYPKLYADHKSLLHFIDFYNKKITYQNRHEKPCVAEPFLFNTILDVKENFQKHQFMRAINGKINELKNELFKEVPLCILQRQHLLELLNEIAISNPSDSLATIRDSWRNKETEFGNQRLSVDTLMNIQLKRTVQLWHIFTPDLTWVGKNKEEVANDKDAKNRITSTF